MRFTYILLASVFTGLLASPVSAISDNKSIMWAGCGITKTAFMAELAKAYTQKTGVKVNLAGGGATKGIRAAAKGEIDIGGACRPIIEGHPEERSAYQIPVAWDALVVIVHPDNPVNTITSAQLKDIYLGKITNWQQLGGSNAPLNLYIRQGKLSGVGRTLRELVFANYDQDFTSTAEVMKSSGPLEKAIEANRYGFGVTGIASAQRRKVKLLQLNGKEPSYNNIKSGDYVLYRPLYLVTKGSSSDQRVKDFVTFALSKEGREIIRKAGTVPYADAIGLVMKQVEQYDTAMEKGLYTTAVKNK